jgi:DDE superfamily endonuclease
LPTLRVPAVRAAFPPLVRVCIEQLACCEPAGIGLSMTHWSTRTLAKVAVRQGIVPQIAHSTVSLILRGADLQPHRSRYWKTPRLDGKFVERASKILWCYERIDWLREHDEVVVCLDEKPHLQALERRVAKVAMRPGQIEHQEFEYTRHGTVNFLGALFVHDGTMRGWCLERNDSAHLIPTLDELFETLRERRRIHVIWDGGPSHTSGMTAQCLRRHRQKVRVLLTPAHASWLNQAELLLRAFAERYLKRGNWASRADLIHHLQASWLEYNNLLAHPFHWSWTRRKMHNWVDSHRH